MNILGRITELREKKGWTEYTLAEKSGLTQSTISSWYNKKKVLPSFTSLEKICQGLGITLSQFFMSENDNTVTLTESQKQMLDNWGRLSETQREKLQFIIECMLQK